MFLHSLFVALGLVASPIDTTGCINAETGRFDPLMYCKLYIDSIADFHPNIFYTPKVEEINKIIAIVSDPNSREEDVSDAELEAQFIAAEIMVDIEAKKRGRSFPYWLDSRKRLKVFEKMTELKYK